MPFKRAGTIVVPSGVLRRAAGLALGGLIALAGASGARAADLAPAPAPPPPAPAVEGWTFGMSLYGWATSLEGRARTLPPLPTVNVNVSFDQIIKNLDGALMGTAEARNGRWMLFGDLIVSKVSPDKSFTAAGFPGNVKLDSSAVIALAAAGYRLVDDPRYSIDGFAGARLWAMDNTLTLTGPLGNGLDFGKSAAWVDGVVGARLKLDITDRLFLSLIGAVGGLSAKVEWDIYGGLNYAFTDQWSGFAGYRALHVDYKSGDFLYEVTQHGPVLGVNFRF